MTGYPARIPVSFDETNPFFTPGIYSFGTAPPLIVSSKTNPVPDSCFSKTRIYSVNQQKLSAIQCQYRF